MTSEGISEERMKQLLDRAGLPAEGPAVSRRRWPRFSAEGAVRFTRPMERAEHVGELADVSLGGLAFLTDVSLAVGETLLLTYEDSGKTRSTQASVETIHSHPKDRRVLVGAKFVRSGP